MLYRVISKRPALLICAILLGSGIGVYRAPKIVQSAQPISALAAKGIEASAFVDQHVKPVQYLVDACEACRNCPITGVDCRDQGCGPELTWENQRQLPWQMFAHGEYIGPHRPAHLPEYRLRVDDQLTFVYRLTSMTDKPYELTVGDSFQIDSIADPGISRELVVQPDGSITAPLIGQVRASGLTIDQFRDRLEQLYLKFHKTPAISITPRILGIGAGAVREELRSTVDSRQGNGGQSINVLVSPDGTVQLPAIRSVHVQGLTLEEVTTEIEARYQTIVDGIEVTAILSQRAPRFIYVLGEVTIPGRFELTGPTTAMQAIALAQGTVNGANLREIVVFRRGEDWRLTATRLDLRGAILGKRPIPSDEIWLRDSDIVVVPQTPLRRTTDFIQLAFGQGVNEILPLLEGLGVLSLSRI